MTVCVAILPHVPAERSGAWTDERLDDLANRMDQGFERLEARFDAHGKRLEARIDAEARRLEARIDAEARRLDARIDRLGEGLSARIDALQRTTLTMMASILIGFAALIVTQVWIVTQL